MNGLDQAKQLTSQLLLILGGTSAYISLQEIDLILAIGLKFTAYISFACFIIMNKNKIVSGIKNFWEK